MATTSMPAEQSQTKPNNQGGVTVVSVLPVRKVTYVFNAVTSRNLSIPVAVAVDGQVLTKYAARALRVNGSGGKVEVTVRQGQRVHLYLNSDASPDWRTQPVYPVVAGGRDAIVTITEKRGKHPDPDTPVLQQAAAAQAETAQQVDRYTAPLTGDIWMKVSHRYTETEVDSRMPPGTSDAVKAAIKEIYKGLSEAALVIAHPASNASAAITLKVRFEDADNPKGNITRFNLLSDGLTRVHPGGYAALFNGAIESRVSSMSISSCWRPMLGSIAHRAGLGLDVSILDGIVLNREELRRAYEGQNPSKSGNGNDRDNVSDAEVTAFGAYESAIDDKISAEAEVKAAKQSRAVAIQSGSQAAIEEAEKREKLAARKLGLADATEKQRKEAWNIERDKQEPTITKDFRARLVRCPCVAQVFDPWFIDIDVKDGVAPEPNMQRGKKNESLESLHRHHLHITVKDDRVI